MEETDGHLYGQRSSLLHERNLSPVVSILSDFQNLRKAFAKYRIQGVALLDEGGTRQLYPQNLLNHINTLTLQGRDEKAKIQASLEEAIIQSSNTFQCVSLKSRKGKYNSSGPLGSTRELS